MKSADWDGFRDPDQLIYRNYTLIQDGQESFVDGLLEDHSRNEHDPSMPDAWTELLGRMYSAVALSNACRADVVQLPRCAIAGEYDLKAASCSRLGII